MLFGDKSRFAIEFERIENGNFQVPECSFSYWIDGNPVGNYKFEAPIDEILEELRGILSYRHLRQNAELFALDPGVAYKTISNGLIQNIDNTERNWPAFNLTYSMGHGYPLEEGSRYDVYLIENNDQARLLVGDERRDEFIFSKDIQSKEVDEIILSAWNFMADAE